MKNYENLIVDFEHCDDRGQIIQLVHDGYKQINVLKTLKNCTRGKHYHKHCREAFFVLYGCVEVTFSSIDGESKELFKKDDFFSISPNVMHTMYFPDDCLMVQMYDHPVEDEFGNKDIYTE